MQNRKFILSLLFVATIKFSVAQNEKIKSGRKNYNKFSYSKAIEKYETLDIKTTDVNRQLGESYYIAGNSEKAEKYYETVVASSDAKPEDYYRYGFILRVNNKYPESEKWIKKFGETRSEDSRVEEYLFFPGATQKLMKDEGRYQIINMDINSEQEDFGAAYYNNKLVFASSREGVKPVVRRWNGNGLPFLDIYQSSILIDGQLTMPELFADNVNKKYHEGPVVFSEDGKTMVFTRDNYKEKATDGTTNLELFTTQLVDGEWKNETPFPYNNKEYSVGHPSLSPDGNTLYFVSNMPGGLGGTDIYKSEKEVNGTWGKPQNLGNEINTEGNEMFPFYHSSNLFFFASDGHIGLGGLDEFYAQVKPTGFGKIKNMGIPVNSSRDDFALILNKEMKSGYFSSNRTGGKGDDDLYAFNLLKPFLLGKTIKGVATDESGKILSNTIVMLKDENGNEIGAVTTGDDGVFSFGVDADKHYYKLNYSKTKYFGGDKVVNTSGSEDVITANIILEKDMGFSLYCLITEKGTKKPLENVKIKVVNNITKKEEKIATLITGDIRKVLADNKLNDKISYNLIMEKEGYLAKTVTYNKTLEREGEYNVHEDLDVSMDKIDIGGDLAKLINIKPIYFDLGKYNIRKDAIIELDKIVKVMNENPNMVVELGSHTDCRGSKASNELLSDNRAKASAAYIKSKIISPERISGKGYGESKLKNDCACEGEIKSTCSEDEHQQNRRTEFIIVKM